MILALCLFFFFWAPLCAVLLVLMFRLRNRLIRIPLTPDDDAHFAGMKRVYGPGGRPKRKAKRP